MGPLVLALLLLTACSPSGAGRAGPPLEPASVSSAGADAIAIRDTVQRFLVGYARMFDRPEEGRELLASSTAGPDLEDWVHWLEIQNRDLDPRISADVGLTGIRILELQGDSAAAALQGVVRVTAPGEDGTLQQERRSFDTPAILIRGEDSLDWRVVDINRDGRMMRDSVSLLEDISAENEGVTLRVPSIYRFTQGTVVNVEVENETEHRIRVDGPHSILQVGGRFLGSTAATPTILEPIPPGGVGIGALHFPPIPLTSAPENVRLFVLEQDEEAVAVELPLDAFPPQEI